MIEKESQVKLRFNYPNAESKNRITTFSALSKYVDYLVHNGLVDKDTPIRLVEDGILVENFETIRNHE